VGEGRIFHGGWIYLAIWNIQLVPPAHTYSIPPIGRSIANQQLKEGKVHTNPPPTQVHTAARARGTGGARSPSLSLHTHSQPSTAIVKKGPQTFINCLARDPPRPPPLRRGRRVEGDEPHVPSPSTSPLPPLPPSRLRAMVAPLAGDPRTTDPREFRQSARAVEVQHRNISKEGRGRGGREDCQTSLHNAHTLTQPSNFQFVLAFPNPP